MNQKATKTPASETIIDERLAKALAHPVRVQILVDLNLAPMSPKEFVAQHGGSVSNVAYHFRELAKLECIECIDRQPRRGAVEHYYRATKRALHSDSNWPQLPAVIRGGMNATILNTFNRQVLDAIEADTMDAREDSHFTWVSVRLDEEGWTRVMDKLGTLLEEVQVEGAAAETRLAESGEEPVFTTVSLAGFESPKPKRERPESA